MHVLDQDAPGLAERLRTLPAEIQQDLLAKACLRTAEGADYSDPIVTECLAELRSRGALSERLAAAAVSASKRADEQYIAATAQTTSGHESLRIFSVARLLRAMGIAFGAVPDEGPADAVYELTRAVDDPSTVIGSIQSGIRVQAQRRDNPGADGTFPTVRKPRQK